MPDLRSAVDHGQMDGLPVPPTDSEKYSYIKRSFGLHATSSIVGSLGVIATLAKLGLSSQWLWVFLLPFASTVAYRMTWLLTVLFSRDFDLERHRTLIRNWNPMRYPSVDIFLPICGEEYQVVRNTWHYISRLKYPGIVTVYCLDDGGSDELEQLAREHGFVYLSRPNRGWHKKAGNLRYGYEHSEGELIVVFDADFCPRHDFLLELVPYFDAEPNLGIVQSPQYFHIRKSQNWLERGAGAVQEPFYRVLQTARQQHNGAICVGSNAIYRRKALDANGGNTLIDYSEDVHTGIDLRRHGWDLRYIPIVLATGLCPSQLPAFFAQQYRWCRGCLSVRFSRKFWSIRMPLRSRLSYISGPLYYMHQIAVALVAPILLLSAMVASPEAFNLSTYALLTPWLLVVLAMLPLRRGSSFKADKVSSQIVSCWACLFATFDLARGTAMPWQPTGGKVNGSRQFKLALTGVFLWSGSCGVAMMALAAWLTMSRSSMAFVPVFILGLCCSLMVRRVVLTAKFESQVLAPSESKSRAPRLITREEVFETPNLGMEAEAAVQSQAVA